MLPHEQSALNRSKRLALTALIIALVIWLVLLITAKFLPEYQFILHILLLSAEAGVVGGLADWYAVTVLFRNPFGKMPIPAFLRNHTEILPRNKARIAQSMGKFIQTNFLSPTIVQTSLQRTDMSLIVGQWLAQPHNNQQIVSIIQQLFPRILDFIGQQQLADFIKQNTVQWLKNTPIHQTSSQVLRAIIDNDFHQEVLQQLLDQIYQWIIRNPQKVKVLIGDTLKEMGLWKIVQGASFFGYDVQQRSIEAILHKVQDILQNPEHELRIKIEQHIQRVMQELTDPEHPTSQRTNHIKNQLLDSPALLNFITQAVAMLCDAIKYDLQQPSSGIALHLQSAIQQLGENLQKNQEVRELLNQRLTQLAVQMSEQYGDKVVLFVSQQIESWDSREMINKIENAVGGDLHMIRVNGVAVGAMIGLGLGLIRAVIEWI